MKEKFSNAECDLFCASVMDEIKVYCDTSLQFVVHSFCSCARATALK